VACLGSNGYAGRYPVKHKKRRHEKSAANPEHTRQEPDGRTHAKDHGPVDGKLGDGKVDFHGSDDLGRKLKDQNILSDP